MGVFGLYTGYMGCIQGIWAVYRGQKGLFGLYTPRTTPEPPQRPRTTPETQNHPRDPKRGPQTPRPRGTQARYTYNRPSIARARDARPRARARTRAHARARYRNAFLNEILRSAMCNTLESGYLQCSTNSPCCAPLGVLAADATLDYLIVVRPQGVLRYSCTSCGPGLSTYDYRMWRSRSVPCQRHCLVPI